MMRATFCLNGPDEVNGPNVWLTRHLPLLRAHGIDPEIHYLSWYPEKPCRFRRRLEAAGVPTRFVRLTRFLEDNIEAILRPLVDDPPHVFVPNYSVPGHFAARFLREAGVVTIGVLHSDDPYYHDILDMFANGPAAWRLSGLVGVSRFLADLVKSELKTAVPYLDAPYGAPMPRSAARHDPGAFRLVYCGRLVERQKRVRRVAESMVAAVDAVQGCEGALYGDGPEREPLRQYLQTASPDGRVALGGILEPDAIQEHMLKAQAFVLLSDFEGLSIALMEAMASGLVPIIARMRSGSEDLVVDGVNGFVVDPDDKEAFVRAVRSMAMDPVRWRELSAAARETIVARGYSAEQCAERWAGFLRRLVAGQELRTVSTPPQDEWHLPPRSSRPDGIRSQDCRNVRGALESALGAGRPVYLWGASLAGEVFINSNSQFATRLSGFVDSNAAKHGTRFRGLEVFSPETLSAMRSAGDQPFVVITSQFAAEIGAWLVDAGFIEELDFVAS